MADVCAYEPGLIAFAKTFGASAGILGAAGAWLINKLLGWGVWEGGRLIEKYEAMKLLRVEIKQNLEAEAYYDGEARGRAYVESLKAQAPADVGLTPYVTIAREDYLLSRLTNSGATSALKLLPLKLIDQVNAYYKTGAAFSVQLADFRSEAFAKLSRPRQEAVLIDTFRLGALVRERGTLALAALEYRIAVYGRRTAAVSALAALALAFAIGDLQPRVRAMISALDEAVEWARTCDPAPHDAGGPARVPRLPNIVPNP